MYVMAADEPELVRLGTITVLLLTIEAGLSRLLLLMAVAVRVFEPVPDVNVSKFVEVTIPPEDFWVIEV